MGAVLLDSTLGKVHRFSMNPRKISDGVFTKLVESVDQDPKFLGVRGIVVWEVPKDIGKSHPKSPFVGQAGKIVVIGGNQRYLALQRLGYDVIPEKFMAQARNEDGSWWTPEEAERFALKDNNPEGMSGETDYDVLLQEFDKETMRDAGIDFAEMPLEFQEEMGESTEEKVEHEEHGEMDEELEGFIERREKSRGMVNGITDVGYYRVPVFESTDQALEFDNYIKGKFGIEVEGQFLNGIKLAQALGMDMKESSIPVPEMKPVKELQEMAMNGEKEGWEVNAGDMEEGEAMESDDTDEKNLDEGTNDVLG